MPQPKDITWEEVERMAIDLGMRVVGDNFLPDFVSGISRGGYLPAVLLSFRMPHWIPICYVNVRRVADKPGEREFDSSSFPANTQFEGARILLCGDMLETGRSLIVAKEWLEQRGCEVRTLCFYTRPDSEIVPDYVFEEQIAFKPRFPWERFRES